jgi:hypothetical protein
MSTSVESFSGIDENRMRVRPCGWQPSGSRSTDLVAKLALAVGRPRNVVTGSSTFSLSSASTEQSLFSPVSWTQACGST